MVKFFCILLTTLYFSYPQLKNDPEGEFRKAVELYSSGKYEEALKIFQLLASDNRYEKQTAAEIFSGKISLELDDIEKATRIFDGLYFKVKDSGYREEILLSRGILFYEQNKFYESSEMLLELLSISNGGVYEEYSRKCLDTIAVNKLTPDQISVLYDISPQKVKPTVLLLHGKSLLAAGNKEEAIRVLDKLIKQYPSSFEKKEAEDYFSMKKTVQIIEEGKPVVTVLFPSGNSAADEITEGLKFAIHQFNSKRSEKIGLQFIEFEKEKISQIKEQVLGSNTKCIIGPLFSEDVRTTLNEFKGIPLPIISPTATDIDLTGYNQYFFQANPNFNIRGRAIAQYIYYVENKRKIGVLNSLDGYSPMLASAFIREFKTLGGEIIFTQTYKSGNGSFDEPVSLLAQYSNTLEGLYLPVSDKQDITPLLSSLSKNNISVQLYGNQDWFLGKGYESFPLVNNLVFTSDYFIDYGNYAYYEFNEEFKKLTNREAERNELYGYDLMKYILNQLSRVNSDIPIIADRMMNGNTVNGFHNNISFDEERVNKFVNIIRYHEGIFELVDKFRTSR